MMVSLYDRPNADRFSLGSLLVCNTLLLESLGHQFLCVTSISTILNYRAVERQVELLISTTVARRDVSKTLGHLSLVTWLYVHEKLETPQLMLLIVFAFVVVVVAAVESLIVVSVSLLMLSRKLLLVLLLLMLMIMVM
jgi:hypothetical protein